MNVPQPEAMVCLRVTECLAAVAAALMSCESLAERRLLDPAHPAAWGRHPHPRVNRALKKVRLSWLFGYRPTVSILLLRLMAALLVVTSVSLAALWPLAPRMALLALLLVSALWQLRARALLMASDQLVFMCILSATVAEWLGTRPAYNIALGFVAALAALAYGTAGTLKLRDRGWFDGRFLLYIAATDSHGHARTARSLRQWPKLASAGGIAAVGTECALCVAWLLPPPLCLVVLVAGVLLHAGIARIMGLNTYMWAFAASYPATFYVSTCIWK